MAAGDRRSLAVVNVLGVSPYGRFSDVLLWPVLGVHRGLAVEGSIRKMRELAFRVESVEPGGTTRVLHER